MVVAAKVLATSIVMVSQIKTLVAHTENGSPLRGQRELVLSVQRGDVGDDAVVGVGGALAEGDRDGNGGTIEVGGGRRARVVEVAGLPEVVALLPPELRTDQQRVPYGARPQAVGEIGLIEHVATLRRVVVCAKRHLRSVRAHRTRKDVLVELVVIGESRTVLDLQSVAARVLDRRSGRMDSRLRVARIGIPEERRYARWRRPALERGDPAIDGSMIIEQLVPQVQCRTGARGEGHRRIDAVSLDIHAVAKNARVLVHAVKARRHVAREALADIHRHPLLVVRAALQGEFAHRRPVRLLGNAVDHTASTTTPEDHRVPTLQPLHPLDVVQIAEVLHIVAHSVDEEVGG